MKVRVLTSILGLALLAVVLLFFETPIFVAAISVLSALAVYELTYSTKLVTDKVILTCGLLFSCVIPFMFAAQLRKHSFLICFTYIALLCGVFLIRHAHIKIESLAVLFMVSILVPSIFSLLVILRETYPIQAPFYIALCFTGAWFSDTGAYFVGNFFGKHKLAPEISPNKTIEGFVGGLVSATLGFFLFGMIYTYLTPLLYGEGVSLIVNFPLLLLIAPFCSAAGVCGDLFASIIKRQSGIKDYGFIMPGHGGVMDRFDSFLFVAPALFICVKLLPISALVIK